MEVGHRGLAGLELRWSGYAPLHAGIRDVRRAATGGTEHPRPERRALREHHPGWLPVRLGAGWRILRPYWRLAGPQSHPGPDRPHLRYFYRAIVLGDQLVASVDLPVLGRSEEHTSELQSLA